MRRMTQQILLLLLGPLLVACGSLQQNIEVDLPPFERTITVECYVYPGDSVIARITEAVPFLDAPGIQDLATARVLLSHHGTTDTLRYTDQFDDLTGRGYNYLSLNTIPDDPGAIFTLLVIDTLSGRTVTAQARMMPTVPIDSILTPYRPDLGLSQVLGGFQDNLAEENFYRFIAFSPGEKETDVDFAPDDGLINGQFTFFGTRFLYNNNDSVDVYLYHLEEAHYDFITTSQAAISANGNPFAAPTIVEGNIEGGQGIFAAPGRWIERVDIVQP